MSSYENYDESAAAYAKWRRPLGIGIVCGYFRQIIGTSPRILDVGCGPGQYSLGLAADGAEVVGIDLSEKQLALVKEASVASCIPVKFEQHDGCALPYSAESFDGVLINMVLHHLDKGGSDLPKVRMALDEASRVLRPGGCLIVGSVSASQAEDGAWYYSLCPAMSVKFKAKLPTADYLEDICRKNGLFLFERVVPFIQVFRPDKYFDVCGILDREWRRSTSLFALLDESETDLLIKRASYLHSRGSLRKLLTEHEATRRNSGQITFHIFIKDGLREVSID